MIHKVLPTNEKHWKEMRSKVITSTESPALFGCSKYATEFELYHRKKEEVIVDIDWNERMKWGIRLQDAIAAGVAEENQWNVRPMKEFIYDDVLKLGASFDYEISLPDCEEKGILEVKNVDFLIFKNEWLVDEDGNIEATPQIELQLQVQLALSGYTFGYIAALTGGNKVVLIKRQPDTAIIDAIKAKVVKFWSRIAKKDPPKPDFQQDSKFIASLYDYAEPGKVLDAGDDSPVSELMRKYKQASDEAKVAGEKKDAIKAEIFMLTGDAEKVIGPNFTLSLAIVPEAEIAYTRKAFRTFKPSWRKEKK